MSDIPDTAKIQESSNNAIARFLLPKLQDFYSDPENQKKFNEWLEARQVEERING